MCNCVSVDADILTFLKIVLFGELADKYDSAMNRAYLDFNRTIRFGTLDHEQRNQLKDDAKQCIRDNVLNISTSSQDDFDRWHKTVCEKLINVYSEKNVVFFYGQAQKWVNMTLKYLCVLDYELFNNSEFFDIPIDRNILNIANQRFGIEIPEVSWSRWDKDQYNTYQKELKKKISLNCNLSPIRWEFRNWNSIRGNK